MRRTIILCLTLAILFTQGLLACIHVLDSAVSHDGHMHASAVHLESALTAQDGHEDPASEQHVSLSVILKDIRAKLALFVVLTILFVLFAYRQFLYIVLPPKILHSVRSGWGFSPPVRAPPR